MTDRPDEPLADSAGHEMAEAGRRIDHERLADLSERTSEARERRERRLPAYVMHG